MFTLSLHAKLGKMLESFLLIVLIIAIAMTLLLVKVLLKRNGKFSSSHISDNKHLKERGINCVLEQDIQLRLKEKAIKE